jgi:hypothetical protein
MTGADRYATLVCSLPALPADLFATKHVPLSRLQLDRLLRMLEPEHATLLQQVESVLHWDRLPMGVSDPQVLAAFRKTLASMPEGLPRSIALWRLDVRTVVAALRRRDRKEPPPGPGVDWGYGGWVDHLRRHWTETHFKLERMYPWLPEARKLLDAGDHLGLERLLLGETWDRLGRDAGGHYFDFEAVLVYVLKWDIIRRWSTYNGFAAEGRFRDLADAGLGEHARLFDRGT